MSNPIDAILPQLVRVRRVIRGQWEAIGSMEDSEPAARAFGRYAARGNISDYLIGRIFAEGRQSLFPESWIEALRENIKRTEQRTQALPAALAESVAGLRTAGIQAIVLKGSPFARRYYGDAALRRQADVDLLVKLADASRAARALWNLGYRCKSRRLVNGPDGLSIRPQRLRTEHALGMNRGVVSIDLHWRLRTAPAYRLDEQALWAGIQTQRVESMDYSIPSDEHALSLLLLSIAHDIGRSGCKLKHLLDVRQLLAFCDSRMEWDGFFERRGRENTLRICVNVLRITERTLGCEGEFPLLEAAMARHESPREDGGEAEAIRMTHEREPSIKNMLWFLRVYPVSWLRDARWWLDRRLVHPGSVFVMIGRTIAFPFRRAWRRLGRGGKAGV